ncbi:hypothetical protein FA95DRAFT_1613446 [Auriscalpium vulgare]|uniref:Uncharacterized protein n=1 Tax=Auriscalpium vulgare TaxID=40419 RepID=A0ACB8R413_9AGAM|nr:hypothetical protein FA95DRAFT_1613446 [Auriscalpium vulgare]
MPKTNLKKSGTAGTAKGRKSKGQGASVTKAAQQAELSLPELRKITQAGIQKHKPSPTEGQLDQIDAGGDGVAGSDPEFALAFDGDPKQCSAEALKLFLSFKCFHQGRKESTAYSAYSAIKSYWDERDDNGTFRGLWHFNERTARWKGNPANSPAVQDTLK